jgi:hypothetical protein
VLVVALCHSSGPFLSEILLAFASDDSRPFGVSPPDRVNVTFLALVMPRRFGRGQSPRP